MSTLRRQLVAKLRKLGVEEVRPPGRDDGFAGLLYHGKDIGHFHDDGEVDIKLGKQLIKREGLRHNPASRVHPKRAASSPWMELRLADADDVDAIVRLIKLALGMTDGQLTYDDVFALGLKLPGVSKHTNKLGTSLKANGKMLACPALNKQAEPDSLMVCVSFDQREELLFTQPEIYYLKPHYASYPCVLVRLEKIARGDLRYLLETALAFINAPNKTTRKKL